MHSLLLALLLAPPSLAPQDDAAQAAAPAALEPAPELQIYAPFVGQWEGDGVVTMVPGMPAMKWTATLDLAWILDGHALLEVMRIELGQGIPGMEMVTVRAYDRAERRIVECGASTSGGFGEADIVHSPKAGVVAGAYSGNEQGQTYADHVTWTAQGDEMSFVIHRSSGGLAPFEYVKGDFTRKGEGGDTVEASATRADALAPDLAPLKPMLGQWKLSGTWRAVPDMPEMKIHGEDEIFAICGGQALMFESTGGAEGSPGVYKGVSLMAWDSELEGFRQVWVDNMGATGTTTLRQMGEGRFVSTNSGLEGDTPYAEVSEVHVKDGVLQAAFTDRMVAGESFRAFYGRYERAK